MPAEAERVLVFGDVIDDIVALPTAPIRRDTDTPSAIRMRPGGAAANTAAWLSAAGAEVTFAGRCAAADVARHAAVLETAGVQARLTPDVERPTGAIVIIVEGDHRTMLTERGANAAFSPADVDPAGFAVVHATGYSLVDHAEAYAQLTRRAHAAGARMSLNTGSVAAIEALGVDGFLAAIAGVDILIATAVEAAALTGRETPDAAASALAKQHPIAVVTAGRHGAWVGVAGGLAQHVPSQRIETVDPTGAGDAFTAGLLAGLVAGLSPLDAAARGAATAARAVSTIGGRPGA